MKKKKKNENTPREMTILLLAPLILYYYYKYGLKDARSSYEPAVFLNGQRGFGRCFVESAKTGWAQSPFKRM